MARSHEYIEELVVMVAAMSRSDLIGQFERLRRVFPLDFSDDFLRNRDLDSLRHIYLAICLEHETNPKLADTTLAA